MVFQQEELDDNSEINVTMELLVLSISLLVLMVSSGDTAESSKDHLDTELNFCSKEVQASGSTRRRTTRLMGTTRAARLSEEGG